MAIQVENALDQLVGILHLTDRLVPEAMAEAGIAPVVEHLGVQEVLIDCGQLGGEHLVEQLDHLSVTVHWHSRTVLNTCE